MAEIGEAILRAYECRSHRDTGWDGEQASGPCCHRCVEMFDVKLNPSSSVSRGCFVRLQQLNTKSFFETRSHVAHTLK